MALTASPAAAEGTGAEHLLPQQFEVVGALEHGRKMLLGDEAAACPPRAGEPCARANLHQDGGGKLSIGAKGSPAMGAKSGNGSPAMGMAMELIGNGTVFMDAIRIRISSWPYSAFMDSSSKSTSSMQNAHRSKCSRTSRNESGSGPPDSTWSA